MSRERRVKIVATMGPSLDSDEKIAQAIDAGLNVARLNFSHGDHETHQRFVQRLRRISADKQKPICIMQDLQGPKIRVGKFVAGFVQLVPGAMVELVGDTQLGTAARIPVAPKEILSKIQIGDKLLLDDGLMELQMVSREGESVHCVVNYGGKLKDRKGINVPQVSLSIESLTEKDLADLEFGLSLDVDYVALSFVRRARDVRRLRELIEKKNPRTKICSKIEMLEALDNLEEIVQLSDAVMVARGDLAIEIGQSRLPGVQKEIIRTSNRLNRPVITATQMLESMIFHPRPTRAEITDVANAVLDGSDALMLSAESASGQFPVEAIRTMGEIIQDVEDRTDKTGRYYYKIDLEGDQLSLAASVAASACLSALKIGAKAIVCLTTTGKTAQIISSFRPEARLVALCEKADPLNQLQMVWGIQTFTISYFSNLREVLMQMEKTLFAEKVAKPGDRVVVTLGQPIMDRAKTNSLFLFTLGEANLSHLPAS